MSAQDQMRAMLDQLMGTSRDGDNERTKVRFDDPRVCKSFLLGCCPHDILASTRMDLGECSKLHDLALRADYENAQKERDYFYDIDAMEHLESFISECDRKVELAKRRLKETQEELSEEATAKVLVNAEVIHALGEQIGTQLAKAEDLGAKGDVEGSLKYLEEVEDLKKRKLGEETEYRNSMPASSYQQQKLRVCEVCSAYLGIHDNDRRLADHFGGKLHLGFITIRDRLAELKANVQDRRLQREKEREERRRRRSRSRSKSRDRGDRRRRRSRSRSKSRRHRSRSKSRERRRRSRDRDRRRSRSRDRQSRSRRSRSRDRRRRSRSRDRRRSTSRSKRSRHRSRSQSRSKRSGSRNKSKPRDREGSDEKANGEASNTAKVGATDAVDNPEQTDGSDPSELRYAAPSGITFHRKEDDEEEEPGQVTENTDAAE